MDNGYVYEIDFRISDCAYVPYRIELAKLNFVAVSMESCLDLKLLRSILGILASSHPYLKS